jgi:hypothetical protein
MYAYYVAAAAAVTILCAAWTRAVILPALEKFA